MEAVNKFYVEDGSIDEVVNFTEDKVGSGKIIYEVLRVSNKTPLFLKEHIKRMEKSFLLINRTFPYSYDKINEYVENMISANGDLEGNIKLTYNTETESFRVYYIAHKYPDKKLYEVGVKTILFHGERENPNAKIVNSAFRERVNKAIKEANVYEAILVDNNGNITEGSKSNIFLIKDGKLITAPGNAVLKGVTRDKIIGIAKDLGIEVKEIDVHYTEISRIEAMFISGTSPKVLPIASVDEISMNVECKELRMIMSKFDELIEKNVKNNN